MSTHIDHARFDRCYADVDSGQRQSLFAFRTQHPPQVCKHEGVVWQYVTLGKGGATVLFLPGAAGSYYIWWQQLHALAEDFRLISFDSPPFGSLESCRAAINVILLKEAVETVHIIGSSMGGYLAQYLASTQPERLLSATFANTFVPTIPLLPAAALLRLAIRLFPLSWIHRIYHWFSQQRLVPAGGHDPLLKAYLLEFSHAGLGKGDFLARIAFTNQRFFPLRHEDHTFPLLIIDSDNDPLIRPSIRQAVREMYPTAQRYTFQNAGHFAYLNKPGTYTRILGTFLAGA